jgi:hypothetical protein
MDPVADEAHAGPATRRFALPAADAGEAPPRQIVHGCDYLARENGDLEYYYNFLDYLWDVNGVEVRARHYLDEVGRVNVMMGLAELDRPELASMLTYLQRRFRTIATLEAGGYEVGWTLAER